MVRVEQRLPWEMCDARRPPLFFWEGVGEIVGAHLTAPLSDRRWCAHRVVVTVCLLCELYPERRLPTGVIEKLQQHLHDTVTKIPVMAER